MAEKQIPNYNASGLLSKDALTVSSGTLKYSAPPEARIPSLKFRLYVFKDSANINIYHIYRQSVYLIGRDKSIVDIPVDHPSCSKQHAIIVFRQVLEKDDLGLESVPVIKPYILDLESSNGTTVNSSNVPPARYYQLLQGDVIKFGFSTREYVLMIEDSDDHEYNDSLLNSSKSKHQDSASEEKKGSSVKKKKQRTK